MFLNSDELVSLAERVAAQNPQLYALHSVRILFLRSTKKKMSKNRTVYADTEKLSDKLRAVTGVNFIITFYDASARLDERRLEILMLHELKHVGFKNGKPYLIPHDIEDFRDILREYGDDWITQ